VDLASDLQFQTQHEAQNELAINSIQGFQNHNQSQTQMQSQNQIKKKKHDQNKAKKQTKPNSKTKPSKLSRNQVETKAKCKIETIKQKLKTKPKL
jgi:hypothetical protein